MIMMMMTKLKKIADDHIVVDNETFVMVAAALNDVPLPLNGPTTITNKKKVSKFA